MGGREGGREGEEGEEKGDKEREREREMNGEFKQQNSKSLYDFASGIIYEEDVDCKQMNLSQFMTSFPLPLSLSLQLSSFCCSNHSSLLQE